jgi:hypothetical protein
MALTTGFSSEPVLTGDTSAIRAKWIQRAVSEGTGMVRVNVPWAQIAPPVRPAGFNPTDPSSPGYNWAPADGPIKDLAHAGIKVLVTILSAPTWAEGRNRPSYVRNGTWEPNARQFAAFATAAAKRYSGSFQDPSNPGSKLPAVHYWQAWNEPNLDFYLSPQWTRTGHTYQPASPNIYRGLLNAFYAAVKGVSTSNFVVTAGTAPYGDPPGIDPPGDDRMPPVQFDRFLFCENGNANLTPTSCPNPPHLDALAHHPYAFGGGPTWHARNTDDAAVPDIYKLANVLHAAEREHHVLPAGPKQLWVTEISWDSDPPDPSGAPINQHARWVENALYVLWSEGVNTILWLQIADAPGPNYFLSKGGMYYLRGTPKPAATALRFPFVTQRKDSQTVQAWLRPPAGGYVRIQVLQSGQWKTLRALLLQRHQVFVTTLKLTGNATLRAQVGSQTSLTWQQHG